MARTLTKTNYQLLISKNLRGKLIYFIIGLTVVISFLSVFFYYFSTLEMGKLLYQNYVQKITSPKINIKNISNIYQIKEGDYLWKIAEDQYGSGFNAYDIATYNKITNPDSLVQGQKLILPKLTPKMTTKGETSSISTSQVTYKGDTYTVQPGDFLWSIAVKVYGDGNAASRIINANNLSDPNIVEPGTVLKIPR